MFPSVTRYIGSEIKLLKKLEKKLIKRANELGVKF